MDTHLRLPEVICAEQNPGVISALGEPCEPFGELSFTKMMDVFSDKAYALEREGAKSFLLEDMCSLTELRAAVLACRERGLPVLAMITADDEDSEAQGGKALAKLVCLQELGIAAFGVRDGGCGEDFLAELCREMYPFARVPLYARLSAADMGEHLPERLKKLMDCGVESFGCLDFDTEQTERVRQVVQNYHPVLPEKQDTDFVAANEEQAFFLNPENMECSPAIDIEFDMADELIDFKDESYDVITVELKTHDDGFHFAQNGHFLKLPVLLRAQQPEVLRTALLYYNGRALLDSNSPVEREALDELAEEFGAIVY